MESNETTGPVGRDEARAQLGSLAADGAASGARAAAPWWLIVLHGLSVAGFALSFGLGSWQAVGFGISALVFVGLGMIRPWITRTQAEPWSRSKRAAVPGALQFILALAIIAVGVVAYGHFDNIWLLWQAAALSFATTIVLGFRMERDLARDIAAGV